MGNAVQLTDANFGDVIAKAETPILVDFWAEWCGPCKMIAPILDEISEEMADRLTIGKLDVDASGATAMAYGVMSIPTLILFKGGEPVERLVGYMPKAQLVGKLEKRLAEEMPKPKLAGKVEKRLN
ncbi:MAG: thioredoxin [Caldilineaceae bacterium]|nr:thioredoxin [Caldilineaceae bacterium]MBP8108867.1 thioredoxin [Caldilineaceae bacterium]MBP8125107.1 thioredoxin [Caldilineaceae bacterium]MBP9074943.1 thioredoxin [Caldilineaceae bacterium]